MNNQFAELGSSQFAELEENECLEVTGGIAFIPAVIAVGKLVGGCAVVGFGAGALYEIVLG